MSGPKYSEAKLNELNKELVSIYVDIRSIFSQINLIAASDEIKSFLDKDPYCLDDVLKGRFEKEKRHLRDLLKAINPPSIPRQTFGEREIDLKLRQAKEMREQLLKLRNNISGQGEELRRAFAEINSQLLEGILKKNEQFDSLKVRLEQKVQELPFDFGKYVGADRERQLKCSSDEIRKDIDLAKLKIPFDRQQDNEFLKISYSAGLASESRLMNEMERLKGVIDSVHKESVGVKMKSLGEVGKAVGKEESIEEILEREKRDYPTVDVDESSRLQKLREAIVDMGREILEMAPNKKEVLRILQDTVSERNVNRLDIYSQQLKMELSQMIMLRKDFEGKRKKIVQFKMNLLGLGKDNVEVQKILRKMEAFEKDRFVDGKELERISSEIEQITADVRQEMVQREEQYLIRGCVYDALKALNYTPEADFETFSMEKPAMTFFSTFGKDYRVRASFSPRGEMIARLVRVVESEREKENITQKQRTRDIEAMEAWCKDYDSMILFMNERGVNSNIIWRRPPESRYMHIEVADVKRELSTSSQRFVGKRSSEESQDNL